MNVLRQFPRTFWVANVIELFERWAWYGFYMLFANYLTRSVTDGGLEFSQTQKGLLMGVGTGVLYFLPVITGAIADRYGYKRMLTISFAVYASAFVLLPQFTSFVGVSLAFLYLALGAALFKPVISATVAKTTTEETSSIGFGLFYMMVNLGAFIGPLVTLLFKGSSDMVFYVSAVIISLNFPLLLLYKEPKVEIGVNSAAKEETLGETIRTIFANMFSVFKDMRFVLFLLIVSGFWAMYNQLFFTLPVFIVQWVDTSVLYVFFAKYMPFVANQYSVSEGVMDAEFIVNFDAFYIIAFQLIVSSLVMRLKPLRSMMGGFFVCSLGMALTLATQNVLFTMIAILIFALGEMAGSPKITEYIGRIAPADKKALYMGYSFIPVFVGNVLAGVLAGPVYQSLSDKVVMTQRYAAEKGFEIDASLSTSAYFEEVARLAGMTAQELTRELWVMYSPSNMMYVLFAIGFLASVALYVYDKILNKSR